MHSRILSIEGPTAAKPHNKAFGIGNDEVKRFRMRSPLSVLAAVFIAIVMLPFAAAQPAYADDPVIVESLDGTATPTVRSIAVPYQTPEAPDIKLSSTDPVFKAGGTTLNSDATWHLKKRRHMGDNAGRPAVPRRSVPLPRLRHVPE